MADSINDLRFGFNIYMYGSKSYWESTHLQNAIRQVCKAFCVATLKMMHLPHELFNKILSYKDPFFEFAHQNRTPSASWADEYMILAPSAQYEMINGRIVCLHWDRPYISVHAWDMDMILHTPPTRASF